MSINCPECKSEAERVYPDAINDELSSLTDRMLQFDKLSMYQCTECKHVFKLSKLEIIKTFAKVKGGINFYDLRKVMDKGKELLEKEDS